MEDQEKARWVQELADIISRSGLPRAQAAELTQDPPSSLRRCAGSARARTIRTRVRHFRKFADWLQVIHGASWPKHVGQLLDYLAILAGEPCARTVPRSSLQALSFIEEKGEVPIEERYSRVAKLRTTVDDIEAKLATGAPVTVKTPSLLLVLLVALECLVCDKAAPVGVRAFAWIKVLKVWTATSSDDLRGLLPAELRLLPDGLHGMLDRTKTSGPGKRIRWLPVWVARDACLARPAWLETGFGVWTGPPLDYERDYMVMFYSEDMSRIRKAPADYADMACMNHMVFGHFWITYDANTNTWKCEGEPLLRGRVPALDRALGAKRGEQLRGDAGGTQVRENFLGRWIPEQSDDYLRTARAIIMKLQTKIARHRRQHPRLAEEAQELDRYHAYLVIVTTEERREMLLQQLDVRLLPGHEAATVTEEPLQKEVAEQELKKVPDQLGSLEEPAAEGPYIVSYTAKRKFSRLHMLRGCWRQPGRDFKCSPPTRRSRTSTTTATAGTAGARAQGDLDHRAHARDHQFEGI